MRISILHNRDHQILEEDPGREAREDVVRVAAALQAALQQQGKRHTVERIELGSDIFVLGEALKAQRPEVVVNLCESLAADSRGEMIVPALLEMTGVAHTGSDALSLGLALHKDKAKELLRARGVPTPPFAVVSSVAEVMAVSETLSFPLIVKPSREDASVGIDFDSVVNDRPSLGKAVARVLRMFGQSALVEQYVDGREIYVPLLGNHPRRNLPLTEIIYGKAFEGRPRILSYRAKWEPQSPECLDSASQPASLTSSLQRRCVEVAMAAFEALGCRDYGRVDLRLASDGSPFVIDINPNCDLHPQSGFAKAAGAAGIGYPDLAWHLVELALERSHGNSASATTRSPAARRAAGTHRDLLSTRGGMRARAHRPRADASKP
jgi:D-alanine-D-alanine ligase